MLTSRARNNRLIVDVWGGAAFQMAFIADWTSPNTPETAMNSTITPTTVAQVPSCGLAALSTMPCNASAVWWPISTLNCPTIAPSAASRPNTRPAIATTTSSTGAIENRV